MSPVRVCAVILQGLSAITCTVPSAQAQGHRHHVGLGGGYAEYQFGPYGNANGLEAWHGHLSYRYSMSRGTDLTLEARRLRSQRTFRSHLGEHVTETHEVLLVGPGLRFTRTSGFARRFFHASAGLVAETTRDETDRHEYQFTRYGPGVALGIGLDVRVSSRLAVPVGLHYVHSLEGTDVEGMLAAEVGLDFDFGGTR